MQGMEGLFPAVVGPCREWKDCSLLLWVHAGNGRIVPDYCGSMQGMEGIVPCCCGSMQGMEGLFPAVVGPFIPVTLKLVLLWLPCQAFDVILGQCLADEDAHNCQHTSHSWWGAHQGGGVSRLPGKRG